MRTNVSLRPLAALAVVVSCSLLGGCAVIANELDSFFENEEREGQLKDGLQEGEWNYRHPDGTPKARGMYEKDRQIGPWTYWYANGNVEWSGEFNDGRLDGPTFFGRENGKRQAVGTFVGGLEEDLWTYFDESGELHCRGDWKAGQPELRWAYYDGGDVVAEGYRRNGEQVGPWRFYAADGTVTERRLALPEGVAIVHETWSDGAPRREGFLENGVQEGRWVTWHTNGARRATGDFENGAPSGLWSFWSASGAPLARGHLVKGKPVGSWRLWRNGALERVTADRVDATPRFDGSWSEGDATANAPELAVRTWLGEASSGPIEPLDLTPDPNTGPPTQDAFARASTVPSVRLRPQPWTVEELGATKYLVGLYTDGGGSVSAPPASRYGRRSPAQAEASKGGDPEHSQRQMDKPLPWTRFKSADGAVVDIDDYRGKSKVVLVVLRGMAREVCIYCVSQTEALCDNVDRFRAADCEVFIVYPGERNRLESFMTAFKESAQLMGDPPIGVLYDGNMELVNRMGIQSEFALPSTFVIDEAGVVRFSYVGKTIEDRPPVDDILEAVSDL
jgi:antitoxin component YwqK of YwqJK toxin-antitoxin module/peroxiredoxin